MVRSDIDESVDGPGWSVALPFTDAALHDIPHVVGRLIESVGATGITQYRQAMVESWRREVELLRNAAADLGCEVDGWTLVLEFDVPRRGKRIDAILLAGPCIVVLEFKVGASTVGMDAIRQVEDYALELADFHAGSHRRTIIPAVIATEATIAQIELPAAEAEVGSVSRIGAEHLTVFLRRIALTIPRNLPRIDWRSWLTSPYRPTPTIIEAARTLYAGHRVDAITRSDADRTNLTATQDAIHRAVSEARSRGRKIACFVTGVPGAGKTLAGLNAVHSLDHSDRRDGAVFLSGNGPLVAVLSEALARDHAARESATTVADAKHRSTTFVQNVHRFIQHYMARDAGEPPDATVVVFDEAQRAWNAKHAARKFKRPTSEPVSMLRIMDRHRDWAVLVGLIGGGQEINTGEAGLREWGRALAGEFTNWQVRVSPRLLHGDVSTVGQTLFESPPDSLDVVEDEGLHLSVPIRSYRASAMGEWVNAVLDVRPNDATTIMAHLSDYPIALTRSLDRARKWLRDRTRGLRRCGLVCTSGARRLRPWGIEPKLEFDVAKWFLADRDDVRSSDYLEIAATEFQIQGLELDWVGLCWDADLRLGMDDPYWRFRGTKWEQMHDPVARQYLVNKYRVLMTRAREGLIIWIPTGSSKDPTRQAKFYDPIADYLRRCGVRMLDGEDGA